MPLLRTSNTDLERITLTDPNEWVEVKRKLGKDDERRRTQMILRGQMIKPGETITEFDAGAALDAAVFSTMEIAIKRWNVKDPETNRVADLTAANLRALSDEDVAIITARMDEMYAEPLSDDDRKN